MQVSVYKEQAIVRCRYEEKELVKAIGDYKFNKADSTWRFPFRKLVDIIDSLKIEYSPETKVIYDRLREERQKNHENINLANKIKADTCGIDNLDGIDLSMCYQHQKKAVTLAAMFGSYALFLDPGLGKSLIAIKLIEYWKVPTMIVSPLSTLESVWNNEIDKWAPHLSKVILWENLKEFNNNYDVYIINYAHFKKLCQTNTIEDKIKCLIIDESAVLKSAKSGITKAILQYKDKIPHRLCLTGVPAPNSLLEYFGQMALTNSALLGENFFKFRNTYFFSTGYGGYLYKPMKGAQEAIMEKISHQAYSLHKEDALDLPEQVFETRIVYMDEAQQRAYDTMKKENILEFKETVSLAANELAKICKLREITGGFIINNQGLPVKISDTKINALKELLDEIPAERQVIIWIQYHWELLELKDIFKETACILYGDMPQKAKVQSIEDFQKGKYRLIIAHPLSGGSGINFQQCSYIIWYSLSYSSEQYLQANDRIHRINQKNKCTYFHLIAKGSIDEVIYKVLNKKISIIDACLNMLKGETNG